MFRLSQPQTPRAGGGDTGGREPGSRGVSDCPGHSGAHHTGRVLFIERSLVILSFLFLENVFSIESYMTALPFVF